MSRETILDDMARKFNSDTTTEVYEILAPIAVKAICQLPEVDKKYLLGLISNYAKSRGFTDPSTYLTNDNGAVQSFDDLLQTEKTKDMETLVDYTDSIKPRSDDAQIPYRGVKPNEEERQFLARLKKADVRQYLAEALGISNKKVKGIIDSIKKKLGHEGRDGLIDDLEIEDHSDLEEVYEEVDKDQEEPVYKFPNNFGLDYVLARSRNSHLYTLETGLFDEMYDTGYFERAFDFVIYEPSLEISVKTEEAPVKAEKKKNEKKGETHTTEQKPNFTSLMDIETVKEINRDGRLRKYHVRDAIPVIRQSINPWKISDFFDYLNASGVYLDDDMRSDAKKHLLDIVKESAGQANIAKTLRQLS